MDYDRLLNLTTDLGYQLMASGAEIYRVEESMHRVLKAYGLERPEVFAIPNCIIVSVTTPQGHPITRMRRIPGHGTDIELLERCNDLCRHLCSQVPPLEDAQSLVSALERGYPRYSSHQVLMGYGLAPAFFTLLFGGHFLDGLCAFVCGLAVGICLLYGGRFIGSNSFFRTVVCSTVGSLLSLLLVRLGFGYDVDTVTIGVLMVLVPGVALTNAMREIMAGDLISGLNRTAEAILVATAIALGTVLPLVIGQVYNDGMQTASTWAACVWAFLACVCFGSVFNIQGWGILICGFGAALGWMAYLEALALTGTDIGAAFLAAMVISAFSELMARLRRCPVTGYLQVALLPLVPGAGIYDTMRYCVAGESDLFLSTLLHTIGFAAALSVGAMLAATITRSLLMRLHMSKR